jgi:excisionase family DNA binding protein
MTDYQDNGIPIAEAARRLNISQELIRKRIYRKRLSGYKVDGKWFVFLPGHDQTGQ